jgi:non-ribosomal peptide synthase protein (TIGR01720 family)
VHSAKGLSGLIKSVKESLRRVPNNGIDYLIGRHLTKDIRSGSSSRIIFKYLGQFDNDTANKVFSIANEPTGSVVSPENEREYDWDISGIVAGNELSIQITYSNQQYDQLAMDALMASYKTSLEILIYHCLDHSNRELTPSDLTYKGLTIAELEKLQQELVKHEQ